jgi:predicted ATP-dependent endonuclease of OLD family
MNRLPARPLRIRKKEDIHAYVENKILQGELKRVSRSEKSRGDFLYYPKDKSGGIPLAFSSSLITELAPFIFLLKSGMKIDTLIFEEPEAHLHLEAQRHLACALVRLVNQGTRVIMTTHSDTLIHQINILMRLYDHPRCKEIAQSRGYEGEDFIDQKSVRSYHFTEVDGETEVKELQMGKYGFGNPSMNKVINELEEELMEIDSDSDGDDNERD